MTAHLHKGKGVIPCLRVRGSDIGVRPVQNAHVFLTETMVVSDQCVIQNALQENFRIILMQSVLYIPCGRSVYAIVITSVRKH